MGAEPVVTDLGEEGEVTLLSGVVMHLADSQGVASVRDSGGCEYFPLVDFLVAEMMVVSGIATLGAMRISDITTTVSFAIMAIFSTILISLRSVSLIGGTLTTGTPATDIRMTNIPTSMRIMIPHRFTMTSIGKIWR